jgi:hypothetical protein
VRGGPLGLGALLGGGRLNGFWLRRTLNSGRLGRDLCVLLICACR